MLLVSHVKEFDEFKELIFAYSVLNILFCQPDLVFVFDLYLYIGESAR